ncbi:endoplasmic reticulum aminopeptidase 2-like [Pecten maximus]|uniref:endoplasmic reticulum aminopeptidase 2-like n=1 Tax=Pecten maximus TaxID=6579 RepID=UPI0014585BA8|nr:endoplasmic reticulum aminopeptidase 2-like [Pecten maximus]
MPDDANKESFLKGMSQNRKAADKSSWEQRYKHAVMTTTFLILIVTLIVVFERSDSRLSQLQNVRRYSQTTIFNDTMGNEFPWQSLRLPRNISPLEYHILIYPHFKEKTFSGIVEIKTIIKKQTPLIILHGAQLNILSTKVTIGSEDGLTLKIGHVKNRYECRKLQMHILQMDEPLTKGSKVNIILTFRGKLEKKLSGLYLSNYTTPEGVVKYLATTQFEPTGAREAFPCFDEPDMKAKFNVSIIRSKDMISLFNMPRLTSTRYGKDLFVDTFQQTVTMSTYLVAFIVCDYASVTGTTLQGTKVSVYAPPHQIHQTNLALNTAIKVLNFYNKLFGISYPLPKQDLIAIPDFAAGAMENWGLITFRLSALLYDPKQSSAIDREYVVTVIAHELAHQWFGNLVTLKWWDDLWLNEGFATFIEYLGVNKTDPSFTMMDRFVQNEMIKSMAYDCEGNSHPITVTVSDPSAVGTLFDSISYGKGSSLIRMLSNFIGEDNFWWKIKTYLNTYKYSNARTKDLWDTFTGLTHIDVSTIMDTWTKQMGYPVVTMSSSEEFVQVSQERFLLGRVGPSSSFNYKWYIPFRYAVAKTSGISNQLLTIHPDSGVLKFPADHDQVKWLKGNYGMYGYYRVNYEERNWRALIKQLNENHTVFSTADRAGLIDDVCFLARANKVSQTIALDMTKYLIHERDYLPWSVALNCLRFIGERLRNKAVYDKIQKYTEGLMHPVLSKLGWKDTGSQPEKYLRSTAVKHGLVFGHRSIIEKGRKIFEVWMRHGKMLNMNLKDEIYRAATQYGGEQESNYVLEKYINSQVPSEKHKLLVALCHTSHGRVLHWLFESAAKDNVIRHQDMLILIQEASSNPGGQRLVWQFVVENWDSIMKWFSNSMFVLPSIVRSVTSSFSTEEEYVQVQNFFNSVDTSCCQRDVKASLNRIQMNIDWLKDNEDILTGWFSDPNNF